MEIKMFEVSVPTGMEHNHDGNHLAGTHFGFSLGLVPQKAVFDGFPKFNAEFID
jgi:hypothetical protein